MSTRLPRFAVLVVSLLIALLGTAGAANAQATSERIPFLVGPIPGYANITQVGNDVTFDAKMGGVVTKSAKKASLGVVVQYRRSGSSSWKKFTGTTARKTFTGKNISSFSLKLVDGHATITDDYQWRIHFDARYSNKRGNYKKLITRELDPV